MEPLLWSPAPATVGKERNEAGTDNQASLTNPAYDRFLSTSFVIVMGKYGKRCEKITTDILEVALFEVNSRQRMEKKGRKRGS